MDTVVLDNLTAKQKEKEFKSTQKDMKSKDITNRFRAIEKFKDVRYLIDGGCLIFFLNSLIPKKVLLRILYYL